MVPRPTARDWALEYVLQISARPALVINCYPMGVFTSVTDFAGNFNLEVAFPAGTVFKWYAFIGLLGVVVWSIVTVLLTLLFNLVNDVTGGIEVVLAERDQRPSAP